MKLLSTKSCRCIFLSLGFCLLLSGCGAPDRKDAVKKVVERYLKKEYNQEFIIKSTDQSWNEGDCFWRYICHVYPEDNKKLVFSVETGPGFKKFDEHYKNYKWNDELNSIRKPFFKKVFNNIIDFESCIQMKKKIEKANNVQKKAIDIFKEYQPIYGETLENQNVYETIDIYIRCDELKINKTILLANLKKVKNYYKAQNIFYDFSIVFENKEKNRTAEIEVDSNTDINPQYIDKNLVHD